MIKKLHSFLFKLNPYIVAGIILFVAGYVTVSKEFLVIPVVFIALGIINIGVGVEYGYWIEQILQGKDEHEIKRFY